MDTINEENEDFSESSSGYISDPSSEYGDKFGRSDKDKKMSYMLDGSLQSISAETRADEHAGAGVIVAPSGFSLEAGAGGPAFQMEKDDSNDQAMTMEEELYRLKEEIAKLREENRNLRAGTVMREYAGS